MSTRHVEVEEEFKKLPPLHQTTAMYIALCRVAKIRETAVEARLSVMDLFTRKKKDAKDPKDAGNGKDKPEPKAEAKPATREEAEKVARERNEKRRAWEADFEDVDEEKK